MGSALAVAAATPATEQAETVLRTALQQEAAFIKVHAAEVLAGFGGADLVRQVFTAELAAHGREPRYRIGIWRVLANAAATPADRARWTDRIAAAFLDRAGEDRLHAIESLGKLRARLGEDGLAEVRRWVAAVPATDSAYGEWVLIVNGDTAAQARILRLLESPETVSRQRAAYVLRWESARLTDSDRLALARAIAAEKTPGPVRTTLLSAGVTTQADAGRVAEWRRELERVVADGPPGERYEALQGLMGGYTPAEAAAFLPLLKHEHPDVRIAAGWTILHAARRKP